MAFNNAFQRNAFQNNAFQIVADVVSPGTSISGGRFKHGRWIPLSGAHFDRRRWEGMREDERQARRLAARKRRKIEAAAREAAATEVAERRAELAAARAAEVAARMRPEQVTDAGQAALLGLQQMGVAMQGNSAIRASVARAAEIMRQQKQQEQEEEEEAIVHLLLLNG